MVQTDLNTAGPIETSAFWKTPIPAHDNDTLYAFARFIDDMIYYTYYVENGRTYGMEPYLQSYVKVEDLFGLEPDRESAVKLVDLPCQKWKIGVNNRKHLSCDGKVKASLSIWKKVLPSHSLSTTVTDTTVTDINE